MEKSQWYIVRMIRRAAAATARTEERYVEPFTGYPAADAVKAAGSSV